MSSVLELNSKELAECFSELALLIPKGSKDMPIGLKLQGGRLTFYYNGGSVYKRTFEVDCTDIMSTTVIFYPIAEIIEYTSSTTFIEFTEIGVRIFNDVVELHLQIGYSSITEPEFPVDGFINVLSDDWIDSVKTVLNMNLEKLYSKTQSLIIGSGNSILKYPNTWVKCRTTAIKFNRILDIEHVKLLCKFQPMSYIVNADSIIFKKDEALLMLPCKTPIDLEDTEKDFTALLNQLSEPITLNIEKYAGNVRNLSKLTSKAICNLVVYENGMRTVINEAGTSMSVLCGDEGKVIGTAQIPINVWITFLRALGNSTVQILIGGDIICLRNQTLIILTHARN